MEFLKFWVMIARWGDQLTANDFTLANSLSFRQVLKSSYLIAKTSQLQTNRAMNRR
jgi:hypothetical protein